MLFFCIYLDYFCIFFWSLCVVAFNVIGIASAQAALPEADEGFVTVSQLLNDQW